MSLIMTIVMVYLAFLLVTFLHELGHRGTIKVIRLFPLPEMASFNAKERYGGLGVNLLILFAVWYFKPETFFLQLVGLVAWIHFIFYAIVGSINCEPRVPKHLMKFWVFDDVPNELWWIFIPLGFTVFYFFREYYLNILLSIIGGLI